jgi:hypothetical protein
MGKKSFEGAVEQSLLQAKHFFERNLISVATNAGVRHYGFPVAEGKKRITEWGATSAGLRSLLWLGVSSPAVNSKCESSKAWLLRQQKEGAWEASDFFSAEATAGVLLDLVSVRGVDDEVVNQALGFINSCYHKGYYSSTPTSTEKPHIYTTYLVAKCLATCGRLEKKNEIREWVLDSQTRDGMWGRTPGANIDSLVHTIYAYQILHLCGMARDELLSRFRAQTRTVLKASIELNYVYEEIEAEQQVSDSAGIRYLRLRIQHFVLPALGHLCIILGDRHTGFTAAKRLLKEQFTGGWGPSNDELVMWGTAQAIEYLESFKNQILPSVSRIEYCLYSMDLIPYRFAKLAISLIGLVLFIIFLLSPAYRAALLVGLFLMIVPWVFGRRK